MSEDALVRGMARLAPLLGVWQGAGRANFPTILPCDYTEELQWQSNGSEPLLHFEQKTWVQSQDEKNGQPLHWESGFLLPVADGGFELCNAQNNGRVEVLKGHVDEDKLVQGTLHLIFVSAAFGNDPRMVQSRRTLSVKNNVLRYVVEMATVKTPLLQRHLEAVLTKRST